MKQGGATGCVESISQERLGRGGRPHGDRYPDHYITLDYRVHRNPEYMRVSALNRHPQKAIRAFFYTVLERSDRIAFGDRPGSTIQIRLEPRETAVVHVGARHENPRLFLFNAHFEGQP